MDSLSRLGFVFAVAVCGCSSGTNPAPSVSTEKDSGGVPAEDTWTSYARGFVQTYCVSCHGSSDSTGRDFTVEANVRQNLDEIRCGVAMTQEPSWNCKTLPPAKQFPIGSGAKPSDADRERFVAWITAGGP